MGFRFCFVQSSSRCIFKMNQNNSIYLFRVQADVLHRQITQVHRKCKLFRETELTSREAPRAASASPRAPRESRSGRPRRRWPSQTADRRHSPRQHPRRRDCAGRARRRHVPPPLAVRANRGRAARLRNPRLGRERTAVRATGRAGAERAGQAGRRRL